MALCLLFKSDVLNHAVEINGTPETLASLPIDGRLTISNMSTEWGALSCLFPIDGTLEHWLQQKADEAALAAKVFKGAAEANPGLGGCRGTTDALRLCAYQVLESWSGVHYGYVTGVEPTTEDKLANLIQQMDSLIEGVEFAVGESDKIQTEILPGFPDKISGQITWLDSGNLSTDGILTYRDDVTKDEMARACMQNYDPDFGAVARPGDILVSGYNFGTGSSREQAATAILAKRIPLAVAGSFSNTFARNSINNALICLEVPRLIERLRARFSFKAEENGNGEGEGKPVLTRRTGWTITWDARRQRLRGAGGPE
ncbi:hypothetical protein DL764_010965 [Monosporascus ibericus]|uniref:Aconitase A/isopropylmalate dehydratase small subunit swivel domain-containing protein n=1 Tax=Monosporascus ibericus TaxID=155417 RepID=A0A4Q4SRV1_9PEZI|nr:hypothetical protein DL764_010965 [Monosporascus ibericus]